MAQADGEVRIVSELDASGVKTGAKDIIIAMKSAAGSVKEMSNCYTELVKEFNSDDGMHYLSKEAQEAAKNVYSVQDAIKDLEQAEKDLKALSAKGKTYGDVDYDDAYYRRGVALKRIKDYQAEISKTPDQVQAEQERIAAAEEAARAKRLAQIEREMAAQEKAAAQREAASEKEAIEAEKAAVQAEHEETLRQIGNDAEWSDVRIAALVERLQELSERQALLKEAKVGLGFQEYDQNEQEIAQITAELNEYRRSLTHTGEETKKLDAHTRRTIRAFDGFGAKLKNAGSTMKKGISTLLKYAIGIRTLWALFNKIRAAIKEGLGNMAKYDAQTNASLSALKSSLSQLKNALATAFAPILDTVVPILTTLINKLIEATNAVAMFMAGITGKGRILKATEVQENYAASIAGTGSAAKEAQKYLSGLDEIQTFSSESSGGGGGSSSGDFFDWIDVEGEASDFGKHLRDLIDQGNWNGVGQAIAEKINQQMDEIRWREIGEKIANGINIAIDTADGFTEKFEFKKAGRKIAEAANGIVDDLHWKELGETIHQSIVGAIEFADGFVSDFHFYNLGSGIGTAISQIDLREITESITSLIMNAFSGALDLLGGLLVGLDWKKLGEQVVPVLVGALFPPLGIAQLTAKAVENTNFDNVVQAFGRTLGSAFYAAKKLGEGVKEGIKNNLETVWSWLQDKFTEEGKLSWGSFIDGLTSIPADFAQWFKEHVVDNLVGGFNQAKNGDYTEDGIKASVTEAQSGLKTIKGANGKTVKSIESAWSDLPEFIEDDVANETIDEFEGLGKSVKNITEATQTAMRNSWKSSPSWFKKNVTDETAKQFESLKNSGIVNKLKDARNNVQVAWSGESQWFKKNVTDETAKQFESLRQSGIEGNLKSAKTAIQSEWSTSAQWFDTNVTSKTSSSFENLKKTGIVGNLENAKTSVQKSWAGQSGWFKSNVENPISDVFGSLQNKTEKTFATTQKNTITLFEKMASSITTIFTQLEGTIAGISNSIGYTLSDGIKRSMNNVIYRLNSLRIIVPGWVPGYGGQAWSFNIPLLASGAVIPPNAPFMAMLGDQRRGTNIEAPENLLRQIVREESGKATYQFVAQINRKTLFDQMIEEAKMRQIMTGRDPFAV